MSRSLKKGPYVDFKLAKKIAGLSRDDRTVINTWARSSTISPDMVGHTGNLKATIKAIEFLDAQFKRIIDYVEKNNK